MAFAHGLTYSDRTRRTPQKSFAPQ
jgi:hypothetical protein